MEFQGYPQNLLTRADGLILLTLFAIFMYYLFDMALSSKEDKIDESDQKQYSLGKSILLSIIGIIGIIIGGQVVVNLASSIALAFGMSENLIGLTIVAIGNIVGSNLFNILFILGLSATKKTVSKGEGIILSLMYLIYMIFIIIRR